jgi:hypothetical protein
MRHLISKILAVAIATAGLVIVLGASARAAADDQAALQADHAFVEAAAKADTSTLAQLLDTDLTWTDAAGRVLTRSEVLRHVPRPLIANQSKARITENDYGRVEMVQVHRGRDNVLRVWVRRPEGWRVIVYQEVRLRNTPPKITPSTGKTCDNPCKTLPYQPKNENERAVIKAFMALQTATMLHDTTTWAKYVADEFTGASSNSNKLISKTIRIADLKRSRMAGYAPMPIVTMCVYDLGNVAILVTHHQPVNSGPVHITRVWIKRNGHWLEAASYMTRVPAGQAKP